MESKNPGKLSVSILKPTQIHVLYLHNTHNSYEIIQSHWKSEFYTVVTWVPNFMNRQFWKKTKTDCIMRLHKIHNYAINYQ